ncbi:hypothetical protein SD457_10925 [Coprobacillaceae bacterium CR2/5/TPMF4]|nr:hypothetical protein SD457_10925 [Coprobacillaceae bacterium CR2/5/TPMF4]
MPNLLNEIRKEYKEWKENPARLPDFATKRMNFRDTKMSLQWPAGKISKRQKRI